MAHDDEIGITLERNDGSETFHLKATNARVSQSNSVVTDSVLSGLREIIGGKFVFENESHVFEGIIKGVDPDSYPNSSTYTDHNLGMETELRRAHKTWGWTNANGFDLLYWGPRPPIQGVWTDITIREDAEDPELGAGAYTFELEFRFLDAFLE